MAGAGIGNIAGVRSWLFTPGTRPERFARAGECGSDAIIVDLEDAVAPADKDAARSNAVAWLAAPRPAGPLRAVRINPPSSRSGLHDLDALLGVPHAPEIVVVPKCDGPGVIALVSALFAEAGTPVRVVAMVESAAGVAGLAELVRAPGLAGLALGTADLAADLGCAPDGPSLDVIRTSLVVHAASAGLAAIDAPSFSLDDDAVAAAARAAAARGFDAMAAIHPAQVAAIHRAFVPSAGEIAWATRVIDAVAGGAARLDGQMVDEAMARRARRVLSRTVPAAT